MASTSNVTRFICLFHSADRANAALVALQQLGITRDAIQVVDGSTGARGLPQPAELTALGVPERDVDHLQKGLRNGGSVIALDASEDRSGAIERVFHEYSADKIDEADAAMPEPAALPVPAYGKSESIVGEAVIPVAEEELVVGKREVDRGGVRVYQRTVAEPVQQDINLHGERVVLEYREVNRPVTQADLVAGDQQIELVETAEIPVVQKVARVVEEVHVGKVETNRTELIEDTVRHTEVEVESVDPVTPLSST